MNKRIRRHRKKAGLTQEALGQTIWPEISLVAAKNRIRRVESGEKELTARELQVVFGALGIPLDIENSDMVEYLCVRKKFPELDALVKMLYFGINTDNEIMVTMAWEGFMKLADQKRRIGEHASTVKRKIG